MEPEQTIEIPKQQDPCARHTADRQCRSQVPRIPAAGREAEKEGSEQLMQPP